MALPLSHGSGVAIFCFHHPSFTQLSILLVVLAFGSLHPLLVIAFDIIFLLLDACLVASLSLPPEHSLSLFHTIPLPLSLSLSPRESW